MRKVLVLIAGAAVAYGLVGAAASSLQVSQTVIPAQGNVGDGIVGQCTIAVAISYRYVKDDGSGVFMNTTLDAGDATHISEIIVTPVDPTPDADASDDPFCTFTDAAIDYGDRVALAFAEPVPGFELDPVDPGDATVDVTGDPATFLTDPLTTDQIDFLEGEGIDTAWGGWVFNTYAPTTTDPVFIADFDPGVITVTLWRIPAATDPGA